jgi:cytoskeletal protein RodZ
VALLSALALAGCGSTADDSAATAGPPLSTATESVSAPTSSSASPTDTASSAPASSGEGGAFVPLGQDGQSPGSGEATVTGVRTGEHDGYERVVIDVQGDAGDQAGWFATAVDQPLQDASGELLDVDGDRYLNLNVTGIANGSDGQTDSAGRPAFTGTVAGSGGLVEEVYVGGAWEGQAQVLLGLDDDATEYRVLPLGDPQRIVVDVR